MKITKTGVTQHVDFSEVGIADGLVAWYPLNGDAKDYTINRNDGTVNGAVVTAGLDGKLAYEFDGVDDYIGVAYAPEIKPTTEITISTWVYVLANPSSYCEVVGSAQGGGWALEIGDSTFRFGIRPSNHITYRFVTAFREAGKWYHYVGVFDGRYMRMFLDGALAVEYDTGGDNTITYTANNGICLGSGAGSSAIGTPDGYYSNVKIQDVRIYNRALTPEEIKILYDLTAPSLITMKQDKNTVYVRGEFQETL